jgi:hypothetical protein
MTTTRRPNLQYLQPFGMAALPIALPNLVPGIALPPAPNQPATDDGFKNAVNYVDYALGEICDIILFYDS